MEKALKHVDVLQAEETLALDPGQRESTAKLWICIMTMICFIVLMICKEFTNIPSKTLQVPTN